MTDTEDRAALEDRLRATLRRRASGMFADDTAPPSPAARPRRAWWPAVAAAVLVVAVAALAAVLLRSPDRTAPSAGPDPRSSSTPTTTEVQHYPEASDVDGVTVRALPADTILDGRVHFGTDLVPKAGLTVGRPSQVVAHISYSWLTRSANAPRSAALVVRLTARGARLTCPDAFLIRPLHEYDIACTLVPAQRSGSVTVAVSTIAGVRDYSDTSRFSIAELSHLGAPRAGERTLLNTTGTGDSVLPVKSAVDRGELYAACIGGGTINVRMPGHGGFTLTCDGVPSGASLPMLGRTVRVSGVRDQQWRVAVFGR